MDQSKMDDFVANAALLAAHLTRQCERAIEAQESSAKEISQSADRIRQSVAAGQQEIAHHARDAVREAMTKEIPLVTQSLGDAAGRLREMSEHLRAEQSSAGVRMRMMGWKSFISLLVSGALIVAATGYVAWHNLQRASNARVDAQVLEALQQVSITSCDGRPCVKLEDGLRRWSKNDEYVLLDAPVESPARNR